MIDWYITVITNIVLFFLSERGTEGALLIVECLVLCFMSTALL